MAPRKKLLRTLFSRFISNKASQEENTLLWRWFWHLDARTSEAATSEKEYGLVKERLWGNILLQTHPAPAKRTSLYWKRTVSIAAAIAVLMVISYSVIFMGEAKHATVCTFLVKSDARHIQSVVLPDSTVVIMNINSSISYTSNYGISDRRITFSGEGYFKVHKDVAHPFIVSTGKLETQALGTAFNVEALRNEQQIRVSLIEGSVAVGLSKDTLQRVILTPGYLLSYDLQNGQMHTASFSRDVAAWVNGGLSFNNISLTEAIARMEARYGISIRYQPKQLAGKTVTASFTNTSWQNMLSNVLFPHHLQYTVHKGIVVIR